MKHLCPNAISWAAYFDILPPPTLEVPSPSMASANPSLDSESKPYHRDTRLHISYPHHAEVQKNRGLNLRGTIKVNNPTKGSKTPALLSLGSGLCSRGTQVSYSQLSTWLTWHDMVGQLCLKLQRHQASLFAGLEGLYRIQVLVRPEQATSSCIVTPGSSYTMMLTRLV